MVKSKLKKLVQIGYGEGKTAIRNAGNAKAPFFPQSVYSLLIWIEMTML